MATITRENIGVLTDKLTVKLSKEDYISGFEKNLKNFAKQANIQGFRKGMVPVGVIKKMYGQSLLTEEVVQKVEKELGEYLDREKLEILAQPMPMEDFNDLKRVDVNAPADYDFSFEIGLRPEIAVDLSKIKVDRYLIDVTETMVEDELGSLKERLGEYKDIETLTENDNNSLNVIIQEADSEGNLLEGSEPFNNTFFYDELSESAKKQFLGKKKGDNVNIQAKEAFDDAIALRKLKDGGVSVEDEASKEKYFQVTIDGIKAKEEAVLDKDLFEKVFPGKEITTLEDFKAELKKNIEQYYLKSTSDQLHHSIYHELIDQVKVEFPNDFLKRWMLKSESNKTSEQIDSEFPSFTTELKWSLVTDKLAKEFEIKVERDDLMEFARARYIAYLGQYISDLSVIDEYAAKALNDQKFVNEAYNTILFEKLYKTLEEKVSVADKAISLADYEKMVKEHNELHHHSH